VFNDINTCSWNKRTQQTADTFRKAKAKAQLPSITPWKTCGGTKPLILSPGTRWQWSGSVGNKEPVVPTGRDAVLVVQPVWPPLKEILFSPAGNPNSSLPVDHPVILMATCTKISRPQKDIHNTLTSIYRYASLNDGETF